MRDMGTCAKVENAVQLELLPKQLSREFPSLEVSPWDDSNPARKQLELSRLPELSASIEIWSTSASTRELQYATHGIYRFFGKFPPPIARHLITSFCSENDSVFDPMCGSGTSGVEALLLGREAEIADVNPFSVLLARTKIQRLRQTDILDARDEVRNILARVAESRIDTSTPGLRNPRHWFLDATIKSLARIRFAIETVDVRDPIRDFLKVVFASVVRRVSRATTQQGRLFLDAATAIEDAEPLFFERLEEAISPISSLPEEPKPSVHLRSAIDPVNGKFRLIICHPPYYNSYRYSSINSLEMAWLRMSPIEVRVKEVREAFKIGKPEKIQDYVTDMCAVLKNLAGALDESGILALMIGDTVLRGQYVPATRMLLDSVPELRARLLAIRVPKYTEASWVASQRRNGDQVGVSLCDYVILLSRS